MFQKVEPLKLDGIDWADVGGDQTYITIGKETCSIDEAIALHAFLTAALGIGWRLVPIEPTQSMVIDGFEAVADFEGSDHPDAKFGGCRGAAQAARICYAAMLAAAPRESRAVIEPVSERLPCSFCHRPVTGTYGMDLLFRLYCRRWWCRLYRWASNTRSG